MDLSGKNIERLSLYRRVLESMISKQKYFVYSHELAARMHITAVQVRRDMMLIGYNSKQKKGYDVEELIARLSDILDTKNGTNVAVIGIGNLGRALTSYFNSRKSPLRIVAAFDTRPDLIGNVVAGVRCYSIDDLPAQIAELSIKVAMLTLPPEFAQEAADKLVMLGVRGILNYTSKPIFAAPGVFLEEIDMLTALEKVAYFVKENPL